MTERRKIRFVRALLKTEATINSKENGFQICGSKSKASLSREQVQELAVDGIVRIKKGKCTPTDLAANWVKRQMLGPDQYSAQHREIKLRKDNVPQNLQEGVMSQLSIARNGAPAFMQSHHIEAASKFQRLVERAQMRQRTTMSYDPTRVGGNKGGAGQMMELNASAIDARRALNECLKGLPVDCANIVMDVCGLQKGLQLIETERQWPRRSAKLLLRVGLEQIANHFGIMPIATGIKSQKASHWMQEDSRASRF